MGTSSNASIWDPSLLWWTGSDTFQLSTGGCQKLGFCISVWGLHVLGSSTGIHLYGGNNIPVRAEELTNEWLSGECHRLIYHDSFSSEQPSLCSRWGGEKPWNW